MAMRLTKRQRNLTALAGLVAGIAADQIIDPRAGMVGHMAMLVVVGAPVAFIFERYFRRKNKQRNAPHASPTT